MFKQNHVSISQVENGFTVDFSFPKENSQGDWDSTHKEYIYATLEEVMSAVEKYFKQ